MKEIAKDIHIETQFHGVTLGAINTMQGLIQIDSPPSPDDGRTWRATLLNVGSGLDRLLINLDSHPDRTLGVRTMECTTLAHENTAQVYRSRPNLFKPQSNETGAEWELFPNLGNIRWTPPEITFTRQMTLYWSDSPVVLEYKPGSAVGSIWVTIPDARVVFVGDSVVKNQPPFLNNANIPPWIETIKELTTSRYSDYTIVSGRKGVISVDDVKAQMKFLKKVNTKMVRLASRNQPPTGTEKFIPSLLDEFKVPGTKKEQYTQRLKHGLFHYYTNHFIESYNQKEEDD